MACGNKESFYFDDGFHLPKNNAVKVSTLYQQVSVHFRFPSLETPDLNWLFVYLPVYLWAFCSQQKFLTVFVLIFSVLDYEVAYKSVKLGFLSIYSCLYKPTKFYILRSA